MADTNKANMSVPEMKLENVPGPRWEFMAVAGISARAETAWTKFL